MARAWLFVPVLAFFSVACSEKSDDEGTSDATASTGTESDSTGIPGTDGETGSGEDGGDSSGGECGAPGTNSELVGDECVCEMGFEWCNPSDPDDFNCCAAQEPCMSGQNNYVNEEGNCLCLEGYEWCSDDPDDLNCCPIGG